MGKGNQRVQASELRIKGYSLSYIADQLKVSRSTLSHWLRDIPYTPNEATIAVIKKARIASAVTKNRLRREGITVMKKGILQTTIHKTQLNGEMSDRDIFMMGVGLFAGKVMKNTYERIELNTSDAKLGALFITWLRRGLGITQGSIHARLHLYPSHDLGQCRAIWSKTLNIPAEQIAVGHVDRRIGEGRGAKNVKWGRAPFGSIKIYLKDKNAGENSENGKKEMGVTLFRKIEAIVDVIVSEKATASV